jgi:hypothetical protein
MINKTLYKLVRMPLITLLIGLSACSLPARQQGVPQYLSHKAEVKGLPGVRYVVHGEMPDVIQEGMDSLKKELVYLSAQQHVDRHDLPPANFLALSGGGDDGAFGAGLLCGWTQSGTRPEFKLVTGISTGALLALLRFSVRNTMMR